MFLPVDGNLDTSIEGFIYTNREQCTEYVILYDKTIEIQDSSECKCCIYIEDIPKLIKALEAAYKHQKGKEVV